MRDRTRTPVVLIAFNRPALTRRVLSCVAEARPERLFLIVDGPREAVPEDRPKVDEVKRILSKIDWDCEVSVDASERNLGARVRIAGGLAAVFDQVESAIILEDDCLPSASFFRFCDELLEKYKDEPRVMMVSGTNPLGESPGDFSYLFTVHGMTWGWATWRRAWKSYDVDLASWRTKRLENPFRDLPFHKREIDELVRTFDNLSDEDPRNWKHDAWDYQWNYNRYIHGGLAITSRVNLVSNIGFGQDATHTREKQHRLAEIPTGELAFPLKHPDEIRFSSEFEQEYYRRIIRKTFRHRMRNFVRRSRRHFTRLREMRGDRGR